MRRVALLLAALVVLGLLVGLGSASAHECTDPNNPATCHPTPVYPNWRGQYVPLFGVNDTRCEDETCKENRRREQRWRDEWGCDVQWCTWADIQFSGLPFTSGDGQPMSVHTGMAADHSFGELAHTTEGHGTQEGNHDSHGGSVYADVCLASDEGTSYDGQPGECGGVEDTQAGANIVDHNPCGPPINEIPLPCFDEYHVVRPLDPAYTQEQMEESQEEIQRDVEDPHEYLCGYEGIPQNDPC